MATERYTIADEPVAEAYEALLEFALGHCSAGLMVLRDTELSSSVAHFLGQINAWLIGKERRSSWPGTELIGHEATVLRFSYNKNVREILANATDRLYGWISPGLPEDLCLIRPDDCPLLVSIAHERDGYLDLHRGEHAALLGNVPLRLIRETPARTRPD
jgi:hypothetical protein